MVKAVLFSIIVFLSLNIFVVFVRLSLNNHFKMDLHTLTSVASAYPSPFEEHNFLTFNIFCDFVFYEMCRFYVVWKQ